jgi:hypothetical protein
VFAVPLPSSCILIALEVFEKLDKPNFRVASRVPAARLAVDNGNFSVTTTDVVNSRSSINASPDANFRDCPIDSATTG